MDAGLFGPTPLTNWSAIIGDFTTAKLFATDCGTASVPIESIKGAGLIRLNAVLAMHIVKCQSARSIRTHSRASKAESRPNIRPASVFDLTKGRSSTMGLKSARQMSKIF